MKKENKKYDTFSKMDIVGECIYYVLMIALLAGVFYWSFFSGEIDKLIEVLSINGELSAVFYSIIIMIGLISFSHILMRVIGFFHPDSKKEKARKKKKRKEFREFLIKNYEKKIKKLEGKK